tara:strand:+ start:419 stop:1138 length:720 start_codon:yes stop_codon:yes gene_type:complete
MAIGRPVSLTSNVASKTISVTATASQTLFTVTGGYRINQVAVFRNGVRLADGSDYTARDGATVTLLSAATVGDVLEFQIFDDFRVADAIVAAEANQTINGNLTVTGTITGLTSVTGAMIGISSAGTSVGAAKTLNFIGAGNTFAMDGDTVNISIAGGGGGSGGGLGTAITYEDDTASPFSFIDRFAHVTENLMLDTTKAGESESIIVSVSPNIEVVAGAAVTVGAGKTMIIDVLQIGDL